MNSRSTNANHRAASPVEVGRYRERMLACWLGEAVGGTLGMPYEGVNGPLSLTYYEPEPTEMVANDDLDIQVVFAHALTAMDRPAA